MGSHSVYSSLTGSNFEPGSHSECKCSAEKPGQGSLVHSCHSLCINPCAEGVVVDSVWLVCSRCSLASNTVYRSLQHTAFSCSDTHPVVGLLDQVVLMQWRKFHTAFLMAVNIHNPSHSVQAPFFSHQGQSQHLPSLLWDGNPAPVRRSFSYTCPMQVLGTSAHSHWPCPGHPKPAGW